MRKLFSILFATIMAVSAVPTVLAVSEKGDVNQDGNINSSDALLVLEYSVGKTYLNLTNETSDLNNDGKINSSDALAILKICVGDYYKLSFNIKEKLMYTNTSEKIDSANIAVFPSDDKITSWESSDKSVAEVSSDGNIKALKAGKTTITATTNHGANASFELTVKKTNIEPDIFTPKKALPIKINDGTSEIEIREVTADYLDLPTESGDKVSVELAIKGKKLSDIRGNNNVESSYFQIIIYKNGKQIDKKQLNTSEIKNGEEFNVLFKCTLTPGNKYSFDFE